MDSASNVVAKRSVLLQWMYCFLAYLPLIAPSMSLGSTAHLSISLQAKLNLTLEKISWFASTSTIATPIGSLTAGFVADYYGRIVALQCANVSILIGLGAIALSIRIDRGHFAVLMFGRVMSGLSSGFCSICPVYMTEVSSFQLRPMFTTISTTFVSLGILLVYLYGFLLQGATTWKLVPIFAQMYPLCSIVLTLAFLPETPVWLLKKGQVEKARHNLARIYGKKGADLVETDLQTLIDFLDENKRLRNVYYRTNKLLLIKERTVYLPFLIMTAYFFIQQFSGVMIFVFYAGHVAQDAGIPMDYRRAILIIAVTRVLAGLAVALLSDKINKRATSIVSGVGVTATLYSLAIFLWALHYHRDQRVPTAVHWVSVVFIVGYMIFSTVGFVAMPFGMVAEVFPMEVRGLMVGITMATCYFYTFLAIKSYLLVRAIIERYAIFLFYGTTAFVGTIFLAQFLPETRHRSLPEIQAAFRKIR